MEKVYNQIRLLGIFLITLLLLITACKEDSITQSTDGEGAEPDTTQVEEPQNNYWEEIDISFAADSYDGHLYNGTEFADFNSDGYVDIINAEGSDGLILYSNSGSGTFFSSNDKKVIFDPADVDLEALGHWGDTMNGAGTFGLADYDKDGYLDAIIEGSFSGFTNSLEPVVIFAKGDGNTLESKLQLTIGDGYDASLEGFAILGSYYFSSRDSYQIAYKTHIKNGLESTFGIIFYAPECEYGFYRWWEDTSCHVESRSYQEELLTMIQFSSIDLTTYFEMEEATSNKNTYLFWGEGIFSENFKEIKEGLSEIGIHTIGIPIQSDIGEFNSGSYGILKVKADVYEDSPYKSNSIFIVKDFENVIPVGDDHIVHFSVGNSILKGGAALDFNEDGLDDIVVSMLNGSKLEIVVYENKGAYQFEETDTIYETSVSEEPDFVRLKKYDFNRDGKTDFYLQGLSKIIINNN